MLIYGRSQHNIAKLPFFATLWTVAHLAPLFMGFSRKEYWSGLPFPSPEDLPDPGIKPGSPALQAHSLKRQTLYNNKAIVLQLKTNNKKRKCPFP